MERTSREREREREGGVASIAYDCQPDSKQKALRARDRPLLLGSRRLPQLAEAAREVLVAAHVRPILSPASLQGVRLFKDLDMGILQAVRGRAHEPEVVQSLTIAAAAARADLGGLQSDSPRFREGPSDIRARRRGSL